MTTNASSRYEEHIVPFRAGDGFQCNLVHVKGQLPAAKGPVILVHGAGVRGNIFRAPVRTTIVDVLIEQGYDVWLENWRASIDLPANPWTLDKAAAYDHPEAVRTVVRETGAQNVKAIVHCQGSTSFVMSAVAGLVPQVNVILSNAVSIHTIVPRLTWLKMNVMIRIGTRHYPYLNPQWGLHAPHWRAKLVAAYVNLTHHECDNPVCKLASFTYGVGFPTLWEHENLNDQTHEWLKQEFGHVPIAFFRQIARCINRGHLVSSDEVTLPKDYLAQPPQTDARFAFFCGELNRCFLPEGQERTFKYLDGLRKGYHSLRIVPGYAHLDIFMGRNAAQDVFPLILSELDKAV